MTKPDTEHLGERAEQVLASLIRLHVADGAPVGSRTLARETGLGLSPATIRNVMADLEDWGLIHAPHTSAGRVPTDKGYRLYINSLLREGVLDRHARAAMAARLRGMLDTSSVLAGATEMLSEVTSFAGIVSTPSPDHVLVRQIEFLKLSEQRVLAILVTDDGQVQNKVLKTHREYSESELIEAANYFNTEYSTQSLHGVREELYRHMQLNQRHMHREMRTAVKMAGQLLDDDELAGPENVLVHGENNLLSIPGFTEFDRLRELFDTLKTKQVLFDLLQKSLAVEGVRIFIGEESGHESFRDCSVIAAPYKIDHRRVGVLGVIGPTRMHYEEVISAVDITARLVGSALTARGS